MEFDAVIVAAGAARRMGFDKILARLAGKTVLEWSLEAFARTPGLRELVVVCPPARESEFQYLCGSFAKVVAGGRERADSVRAGLQNLTARGEDGIVAVHDAARPLILPEAILECVRTAQRAGAAALAAPLDETLHEAGEDRVVLSTPPREHYWRAQTPQAARRKDLLRALEAGTFTDEAAALSALGIKVQLVPNTRPNLKMTRPADLVLAEAILKTRGAP